MKLIETNQRKITSPGNLLLQYVQLDFKKTSLLRQ